VTVLGVVADLAQRHTQPKGTDMTEPEPVLTNNERLVLQHRIEQLVGWHKAGKTKGREGEPYYLMSVEGTDQLRFDVIRIVDELLAARRGGAA